MTLWWQRKDPEETRLRGMTRALRSVPAVSEHCNDGQHARCRFRICRCAHHEYEYFL